MGSRYETVATAEVGPAGTARPPWPPYGSQDSPKRFTQPSLWACLGVKEYLRQDYRGLEDLWASSAELRAAWGLEVDVPRVHAASGDPHVAEGGPGDDPAAVVEVFPAGETGFSRRPASHDSVRRPARGFRRSSMVVGVRPQAIWAQGVRAGPGSPSRLLPPLVRETVRHGAVRRRLAEPTHRWLREEPGIESIIPATGCCPGRARTPYRRRRPRYFPRRK